MSHEHQNTNPRTKKQFDHSVPLFFLPAGLEMKKPHSEANLLLLATNPCITIHLFTLKERPPHRNSGTNFEFGPKTSVVGPLFPRQSIAPVSSSNNGELDAFFLCLQKPSSWGLPLEGGSKHLFRWPYASLPPSRRGSNPSIIKLLAGTSVSHPNYAINAASAQPTPCLGLARPSGNDAWCGSCGC